MSSEGSQHQRRIAEAFVVFQKRLRARDPEPEQVFLERHPELRDLLEPMLRGQEFEPDIGLYDDELEAPSSEPGAGFAEVVRTGRDGTGSDPQRFGDFRLIRCLGSGGMGVVYLAEKEDSGRQVALKLIKAKLLDSPGARERFHREIHAASLLDSPGICPVCDSGEVAGTPYMAMRYVEGETLESRIDRLKTEKREHVSPPLPPEPLTRTGTMAAVHLVEKMARAVHTAHERGLVHRDLKPGNIMVTPEGEPVVLDFGLARLEEGTRSTLTESGQLLGTPAYMAPEQITGPPMSVDRRADVYALGVILYESLTLHLPHEASTREQLYHRILAAPPPDPRDSNPGISKNLKIVLDVALAKESDRRYQTAEAMADDLKRVREHAPIQARPVGPVTRTWKWLTRHPGGAVAIVAAMMLLLVAGYLYANLGKIREAEEQRLGDQVEGYLESGYLALGEQMWADAVRAFEQAIEKARTPVPEAVGGLALAHIGQNDPRSAVQVLERYRAAHGERPGLLAILVEAQRLAGRNDVAARLEATLVAPKDALGCYLRGLQEFRRGKAGNEAAYRVALAWFSKAILYADAPRAIYFMGRSGAAGRCKDTVAAEETAHALTTHWGDSNAAWFSRGFALSCVDLDRAIAAYKEAIRLKPDGAPSYHNLGNALREKGLLDEAIAAFKDAIRVKPEYAEAHNGLGIALAKKGLGDEAIAAYKEAIRLKPDGAPAYYNLGVALQKKGLLDEAIAAFKDAIRLKPDEALAHGNLGDALQKKGRLDEAIAAYKEAIRLRPDDVWSQRNLGVALRKKGRLDEAIAAFKEAIRLRPEFAEAYRHLGVALQQKGLLDKAIAAYKEAIRLKPVDALAHGNLGVALREKGALDEAIAAYKDAIRVKPEYAEAHNNLGIALAEKGLVDESIAAFKETIRLKPDDAPAYCNLGVALRKKGRLDEAIAAYKDAIRLRPDDVWALCALGRALRSRGEYVDALRMLRRGHALGSRQKGWSYPSARWVAECERLAKLATKVDAVAKGDAEPADGEEARALANIAHQRRRYVLAVGLWRSAFEMDPSIVKGAESWNRYSAACSAALAAEGEGVDARRLVADRRGALRRQAVTWLREDLSAMKKYFEKGDLTKSALTKRLTHWRKDRDLAGLRDAEAVAGLPADERQDLASLWAAVDELLLRANRRAGGK